MLAGLAFGAAAVSCCSFGLARLLTPSCMYIAPLGVLHGASTIAAEYSRAREWAALSFESYKTQYSVQVDQEGQALVLFVDTLGHSKHPHRYTFHEVLRVTGTGWIRQIHRVELHGERAALQEYLSSIFVAPARELGSGGG